MLQINKNKGWKSGELSLTIHTVQTGGGDVRGVRHRKGHSVSLRLRYG